MGCENDPCAKALMEFEEPQQQHLLKDDKDVCDGRSPITDPVVKPRILVRLIIKKPSDSTRPLDVDVEDKRPAKEGLIQQDDDDGKGMMKAPAKRRRGDKSPTRVRNINSTNHDAEMKDSIAGGDGGVIIKWSPPIFNNTTMLEERVKRIRPPAAMKAVTKISAGDDDDLDFGKHSHGSKSSESWRQHATRPEPMSMDFVVRPASKVDMEAIRARPKQGQRRAKICKKLQQMKAGNRKKLQATKLSADGRGMAMYV